jgi:hypothetical protein
MSTQFLLEDQISRFEKVWNSIEESKKEKTILKIIDDIKEILKNKETETKTKTSICRFIYYVVGRISRDRFKRYTVMVEELCDVMPFFENKESDSESGGSEEGSEESDSESGGNAEGSDSDSEEEIREFTYSEIVDFPKSFQYIYEGLDFNALSKKKVNSISFWGLSST